MSTVSSITPPASLSARSVCHPSPSSIRMPGWRCERGCSLLEGHDIFTTPDAPALCGKHQGRGAHGDSEGNPGARPEETCRNLASGCGVLEARGHPQRCIPRPLSQRPRASLRRLSLPRHHKPIEHAVFPRAGVETQIQPLGHRSIGAGNGHDGATGMLQKS